MTAEVSLQDVVAAMDLPNAEWGSYLDPETGEIVTVTDEDRRLLEEAADVEELPDWQREILPKVREVLESERFLQLPASFDIHEWAIMERFTHTRSTPEQRDELLSAIHGSGAFRKFRRSIQRLGIENDWHGFRQAAFEEIAKAWLEAHHIPYK
ncbi:MAG: hypothetical protein A3G35_08640 [candidate division NC10 bacterium RIFCSPLOWO2_12_FULL_66_18]|nr:MAG: hypothetical protein A3H39_19030 [candidate division NC10 bacterium RIFCSPLOWO2_02_FULL_66_22]OGC01485.1 MAG: hypothetical protein A3G35_08640 [candidate division NC10 bacterium RIFCSPLOWO2_12_FULL_66_18]